MIQRDPLQQMTTALALFPYQETAKSKLIEWANDGDPSVVPTLVAQMAYGKSAVTCSAIGELFRQRKRVWIICDRIELVTQWRDELARFAPHVGTPGEITAAKKLFCQAVVICQAQTLLGYVAKVPLAYAPDVFILDEAHTTGFSTAQQRTRERFPLAKQINLTATPCRHGSSNLQYEDLYPKQHWHIGATAQYLISIGRWKRPQWELASRTLADATAEAFSGMKTVKGEYDETSQAAVMIRLLPQHLQEALPKIGNRSTVWFCVNTQHAEAVYAALEAIGHKVAFVSGDNDLTITNVVIQGINANNKRSKIVDAYKQGSIQHYITIVTATTGFDAPIASAAVWLRRTLSVGLFCQMAGRVLRKHDANEIGLLLDLACNLSIHPFPEDIDWIEFDASTKMFRDPGMVVCKTCGHRHKSIPVPIAPPGYKWLTSAGLFTGVTDSLKTDFFQPDLTQPLVCHGCNSPVYHDFHLLYQYGQWLQSTASAGMSGKKASQHRYPSAGISIGKPFDDALPGELLTPQTLYDLSVWKTSDGKRDRDPYKDKRLEFEETYQKATKKISAKQLQEQKLTLFNDAQREYLRVHPRSHLRQLEAPVERYKLALAYAYLQHKSPVSAYAYWGLEENPDSSIIEDFFTKLCANVESIPLVKDWLAHWEEKHTEDGEQRKAGLLRSWIKKYTNFTNL